MKSPQRPLPENTVISHHIEVNQETSIGTEKDQDIIDLNSAEATSSDVQIRPLKKIALPPINGFPSEPEADILHFPNRDRKSIAEEFSCVVTSNAPLVSHPSVCGYLCSWVGVHLSLATSQCDVNETTSVLESLQGASLGGLRLLLWLNLWCLRLDLSGTSEGSVNLSHDCGLSGCVD